MEKTCLRSERTNEWGEILDQKGREKIPSKEKNRRLKSGLPNSEIGQCRAKLDKPENLTKETQHVPS